MTTFICANHDGSVNYHPLCMNLKVGRMKKWECVICGLIYDEAEGWPDEGIAPGTKWDEVPEDWLCPDCGTGKEDFDMVEV